MGIFLPAYLVGGRPLAACRLVIWQRVWPDPRTTFPPRFLSMARAECLGGLRTTTANFSARKARAASRRRDRNRPCSKSPVHFVGAAARISLLTCELGSIPLSAITLDTEPFAPQGRTRRWARGRHSPLVADPFGRRWLYPLEALRVGADAFASDLNPVPVLLNKLSSNISPSMASVSR